MMDRSNPAKHSLATRFRLRPQEILIGTPKSRIRPNPSLFNHLIFSTRYKKPPSPPVTILQHSIRIFFSGESGHPMRMAILSESAAADESKGCPRRGSESRLSRAKPRGSASQQGICGNPTRIAIPSESAAADESRGLWPLDAHGRGPFSPPAHPMVRLPFRLLASPAEVANA
jgi:hypothetical protein